ncbi:MAG TPA: MFS transporter [Solirubrobacteraceae bacterium]|nr:MFS transporter [Solirubrobacteraceae bacterium]
MRRLILLVSVLVFVDTMLFAALTPLVPHLARELDLSKGASGALVAAYAAGALIGGIPGGVASVRLGPRRAIFVGLTLMGCTSLGFALANSFGTLLAARLAQGLGSAFTWSGAFSWLLAAAPRERRGEMIGRAMGAAVFGALMGPVVGAVAAVAGRESVFAALSALSLILMFLTSQIAPAPREGPSASRLGSAFRDERFRTGLALLSLGALLSGIITVLCSLHLAAGGWSATAIGAVWLVGAAIEGVQSPLVGRVSDRRGPLTPVRVALGGATVISLGLAVSPIVGVYAVLVVAASVFYGLLFTPSFALIAEGAEDAGLAQGLAFGIMNAAWAVGAAIGPAAGGAIAGATGDWLPFVIAATICAVVLARVQERGVHVPAAVPAER